MCRFADETDAGEIIVATETGIIHRLKKENPNKFFIPASRKAVCPNMKSTSLEKIFWSLEDMKHEIYVEEYIRIMAKKSIQKMFDTGER